MKKICKIVILAFLLLGTVGCDLLGGKTTAANTSLTSDGITSDLTENYTIVFNTNGGSDVDDISFQTIAELPQELPIPTKVGYSFSGWFMDSELSQAFSASLFTSNSITLYAKWNVNQYTITFNSNGGSQVSSITIDYEDTLIMPDDPTKSGYTFDGWYTSEDLTTEFASTTMPLNGAMLYAKWVPNQYTITFNSNGGTSVSSIITGYSQSLNMPVNPTKTGYVFDGWYTSDSFTTKFTSTTMPLNGATLYAKWLPDLVDVKISFYGQNLTLDDYALLSSEVAQAYTKSIYYAQVKSFYGFNFDDESSLNILQGEVLPDGSLELNLYYDRESFTYTFETNATISIDSISGLYESTFTLPSDPVKTGYEFVGWFEDENLTIPFVAPTVFEEDKTVYAKWEGLPSSIYFYPLNGENIEALVANNGDLITVPTPERTGYTFSGWYKDSEYNTPFNDTVMPVGGATIYAKWTINEYILSFNTMSGSLISPVTYDYLENIVLPENPIREGYIFNGWYLDSAYTQIFDYTTMPAMNLTIYANWLENTNPYSILSQITKTDGASVEVEGIVYALHGSGYLGFYIYDETGYVFVEANYTGLSLGDKVHITGLLDISDNIPSIVSATVTNTVGTGDTPVDVEVTLAGLSGLDDEDVYHGFYIEGMFYEDGTNFYVIDYLTYEGIKIYYQSYGEDILQALNDALDRMVRVNFVLVKTNEGYQAVLTELHVLTMTSNDKLVIIENIINDYLSEVEFTPGMALGLDDLYLYNLGHISWVVDQLYQDYYDQVTDKFLTTDSNQLVPFDITLSIGAETFDFTVSANLKPIIVATIYEFLNGTVGEFYQIEATVVSLEPDSMISILSDSTGSVFAMNVANLKIGDKAVFMVRKDMEGSMVFLDGDGDIELSYVVSNDNSLGLLPVYKDKTDILAMDYLDVDLYGQYVEIRGFVLSEMESTTPFSIVTDDYTIPLMTIGHGAFEKLFAYEFNEVIIRGFIMEVDGVIGLYYEGIRLDIRIPDYASDQEYLDAMEQSFRYQFEKTSYMPGDYLWMIEYNPVVGGEITWTMDSLTEEYYDSSLNQLKFTTTVINLDFDVQLTYGTASIQLSYNPVLNPVSFTSFTDIKNGNVNGTIYIEGIVVYWHPDYLYLVDEFGELLYVGASYMSVYAGDEIILTGSINKLGNTSERYFYVYDSNEALVKIVSRGNQYSLVAEAIDFDVFINQDTSDYSSYTNYIEISGKLYVPNVFDVYLITPIGKIRIEYVDNYTYFELERMKDQFVVLKGFSYTFEKDNDTGLNLWKLRYVGLPGDIVQVDFTDQEKVDYIEAFILEYYQVEFIGGKSFDFTSVFSVFPDVDITYTKVTDPDNVIDFSYGYNAYIDEVVSNKIIAITARIVIGEIDYSFNFNFTVLPVPPLVITDIQNLIADDTTEFTIEAIVVSVVATESNTRTMILEDGTDRIFAVVSYDTYNKINDYDGLVGDTLRLTGTVSDYTYYRVFNYTDVEVESRTGIVSETFNLKSVYEISVLDLLSEDTYGYPVEVDGLIEVVSADSIEYYLVNGEDRIRVYTKDFGYNSIYSYSGFKVSLRGFVLGQDDQGNMAIMVNNYKYDGIDSISLFDYTIEEVALMVKTHMEDGIKSYNPVLNPGDYYYYNGAPSILNSNYSIKLTFTIVEGAEFVTDYGSAFEVLQALEDQVLKISVDILVDSIASATFTYEIRINGFTINAFNDLFALDPDLTEIALEATVIYAGWGYYYFLIEEKVYYLEGFLNCWANPGDEVVIVGQKVVIDGVSDFTYSIMVLNKNSYVDPVILNQVTTLEELYLNDFELNPWYYKEHSIRGVLGFDNYANMYTLTDNNYMIYIRLNSGYEWTDYLSGWIGEEVVVDVLLSMTYYRNEYMITDIFSSEDVYLPELTPQENLDIVKAKISNYFEFIVYSGDSLEDYLSGFDQNHSVIYDFGLVNEADSVYFDVDSYVFNKVDQDMVIPIRINLQDLASGLTDFVDILITIKPRENTDIVDVLYGEFNEKYQLQGIVVGIQLDSNGEYETMIIEDLTGKIFVQIGLVNNIYQGDMLELALGDEVSVIGYKMSFDDESLVPAIAFPSVIEVISSGNPYDNTPIQMTFEEVLALDYTDPTIYTQYIEITGRVDYNGSYSYPTYYLRSNELFCDYHNEYYQFDLFSSTYTDFNTLMSDLVGQDVIIKGYLIGFTSNYTHFEWNLYVVEVIANS